MIYKRVENLVNTCSSLVKYDLDRRLYNLVALDRTKRKVDRDSYKGKGRPRKCDYLYWDKFKKQYRKL